MDNTSTPKHPPVCSLAASVCSNSILNMSYSRLTCSAHRSLQPRHPSHSFNYTHSNTPIHSTPSTSLHPPYFIPLTPATLTIPPQPHTSATHLSHTPQPLHLSHTSQPHTSATHLNHTPQPHTSTTHLSYTPQPLHLSHTSQPHTSATHLNHTPQLHTSATPS